MGRHRSLIFKEAVLDVMPRMEFVRQQFCKCAVAWLRSWYTSQAVEFATANREHSQKLGEEGLKAFRADVEALAVQSQEIVDFYLSDDVWWHYDQEMDRATVVYSVRLCMGRLALALQQSGYLDPDQWREYVIHQQNVPTRETDEEGQPVYRLVTRRIAVPTYRHFFQDQRDEGWSYADEWSEDMKGLFDEYDQLRSGTMREAGEREARQGISSQDQTEARIADVLNFPVLDERPPETSSLRLPVPPAKEGERFEDCLSGGSMARLPFAEARLSRPSRHTTLN